MINSLYIAKTGLSTSKYSVDLTSNNIANENTNGYIKRVINTSEIHNSGDMIGSGVSFDGLTRSTNDFLYDKFISQTSLASYYNQKNSILSNTEVMFDESNSSNGFSTTLNNFFNSLESLRGEPVNTIYQNQLSTQSQLMVDSLKSLNTGLSDTINNLGSQLQDQVDSVNSILEQIVYINKQMKNNGETNDLLDKRDTLQKELSNYANVEVNRDSSSYNLKIGGVDVIFNNTNLQKVSINQNNVAQKDIYNSDSLSGISVGDTVNITLNGTTTLNLTLASGTDLKQQIVDKINNNSNFSNYTASLDSSNNLIIKSNIAGEEGKFDISISATTTNNITTKISKSFSTEASNNVSLAINNDTLSLSGGSLKAITHQLTSSTSDVYSYQKSLNSFAKALVDNTSPNGTNTLFSGTDVNSLTFNSNNVASLSSSDLESLSQLQWDRNLTIGSSSNTSFSDFYQSLLVTISSDVEDNKFKLDSQNSIVNSLETTYNNLTKVDPDTEMINLLQYQAAYQANAKIVTAVNEMLQTLLKM